MRAGSAARKLGADGPGRREQREVGGAAVHLGGIAADHRDDGARLDERARDERVLPEHGRADREHEVVGRERLAQADAVGRQVTGEERVILGEAGARAERLLPDRAAEPLGERDERLPGLGVVGAGPDDERRALGRRDQLGELRDDCGVGRARARARGAVPRARRPRRPRRASRPSARSRAPGRSPSPPRGRRGRSRRARPAGAPARRPRRDTRPRGPAACRPGTARWRGGGDPAGRRRRRAARG